jgi:hypothetical protein
MVGLRIILPHGLFQHFVDLDDVGPIGIRGELPSHRTFHY